MYKIRKTETVDIDKIMPLFDMARATMAKLNIDQWQDGYPYRENIEEDVENGESYVVENENGEIIATFMLMARNESTYNVIYDGKWLTPEDMPYATIHRITIAPNSRATAASSSTQDKPVSSLIIEFAKEFAKENDLTGGIRVDTHEGNIAMRKMLEKNGFIYCGVIHLLDGQLRVAYQLN